MTRRERVVTALCLAAMAAATLAAARIECLGQEAHEAALRAEAAQCARP